MTSKKQRIRNFIDTIECEMMDESIVLLGGKKSEEEKEQEASRNNQSCTNGAVEGCDKSYNGGNCKNKEYCCTHSYNHGDCNNFYHPEKTDNR